jgi:hypothetical protein
MIYKNHGILLDASASGHVVEMTFGGNEVQSCCKHQCSAN